MKVRSFIKVASTALVLAFVFGCAEAPKQDMDAAQQAVQEFKASDDARYAADQVRALQDSLDAAMAEVQQQDSKFALMRNYDRAKGMLQGLVGAVASAKEAAAANKQAAMAEADTLMKQLQAGLETAKGLMKKAPKGKEGRAALEMIQNDVTALETAAADAGAAFSSGDYLNARDKAQAAVTKVNSIIEELNTAIGKTMRR